MKKTKNIFLLITLFVFLFSLTFIFTYYIKYNTSKNKVIAENLNVTKNLEAQTVNPPIIESTKNSEPSKLIPKIFDTIYPILGKSKNLTEKQISAMDDWRLSSEKYAHKYKNKFFLNGYTFDKKIALTFDDGPDMTYTPQIINILKENNIKGNFFFLGKNAVSYPSVVKNAFNNGNLVLSHTYNHLELTKQTATNIQSEIINTENQIFKIIGKRPAIIRPPYGDVNDEVISTIINSGSVISLWSIDTLDWSQRESVNIIDNVVNNVRPGDVILMHSTENGIATPKALKELIPKLKDLGYSFTTLDELYNSNAYK